MALPTGYGVGDYGDMVAPGPRIEAYAQALREHVRPGSVVVDIGAGTGVFALLACRLGAARVHAIEPNDAIQVARDAAAANGFSDRMVFHRALSTEVALAERADVVVSDLRGVLPLFEKHIPTIVDARERFLAPGGALIPLRDTIHVAPVESPEVYRSFEEPWLRNSLDLDLRAGRAQAVNRWDKLRGRPHVLLAEPVVWAELDYASIVDPSVEGSLTWDPARAGTLHGFLVWFDCRMPGSAGFSNAPERPTLIYGQSFLPVETPVALRAGDAISLDLSARLVADEYVWRWRTRVCDGPGGGPTRADMRQSTLLASALSPEGLQRREASYVPRLTPKGAADAFLLSRMDGAATLEAIAREAAQRFPALFPRWEDALARAGDLAERHT